MKLLGKFGRSPHNPERVTRMLAAQDGVIDLSRIPEGPAAFDWSELSGERGDGFIDYPMFGNDVAGDCVFASLAHDLLTESGQTGSDLVVCDVSMRAEYLPVLAEYSRFTGYVPGRPATDNGAVMLDVARRLICGETFCGQKLKGLVVLNPKKQELLHAAGHLFGGLWLGWELPRAWQDADVWDVSPTGSTSGDWAPGSWGNHATHAPERSPRHHGLITWTFDQPYTPPAEYVYCVEAYALLWERQWAVLTGDRCPAGVDVQKLMDSMVLLGKASAW